MSRQRATQKEQARYGTPLRFSVNHAVAAALLAESKRTERSVMHVAAMVLQAWYELDYLPTERGEAVAVANSASTAGEPAG